MRKLVKTFGSTQIGWYTVKEQRIEHKADFTNAAWWEDVDVKAGRYPITVPFMQVYDDGYIFTQGAYVVCDATTVKDNFQSLYFGVPIGEVYDENKNSGIDSSYRIFMYLHDLAALILFGSKKGDEAELFPEYEARDKSFVSAFDGHVIKSGDIRYREVM